ncbi:MAG: serine/threonine protein kinase, partial [Anaerolineae bacterium]|nr:serine/threonine protein kinase [Anaerolineae bacterium]
MSVGTVGNYRVLHLIGEGGMGSVFLGEDKQSGEQVAIKVLNRATVDKDGQLLARLRREGEALRRLNHPNIVKIIDVIEGAEQYSIVMEYVPGGTLGDLLRNPGLMPMDRVLKIGLELADALARAHHLKIIHRDIKPGNVLIAADGTPRLTDFGLARSEGDSELTQSGALVGTYHYLSPEALRLAPPDVRQDIWAFGVLIYEMVTGRRPFDGDSPAIVMTNILQLTLPDPQQFHNGLPLRLVHLIRMMLDKNPEARISSMRRVGAELEEIIDNLDSGVREQFSSDLIRMVGQGRFDTPSPTPVSSGLLEDSKTLTDNDFISPPPSPLPITQGTQAT